MLEWDSHVPCATLPRSDYDMAIGVSQSSRSVGRGVHSGERLTSIPRISACSLTTKDFRWLLPEAWNDSEKYSFLEMFSGPDLGVNSPKPFTGKRMKSSPQHAGRWILTIVEFGDAAAVEAEVQVGGFTSTTVHVSNCRAAGGWGAHSEKLSLLISGLMLMTRCDVLHLLPRDAATGSELAALEFGVVRETWTPVFSARGIYKSRVKSVAIDTIDWWSKSRGAADQKTLAYLEKRMRLEAEREKPPRPSKLGFSQRLARFLRWR